MQLKKRISKLKKVPDSCIILGNGSDEVLELIFRAFCEPGRDNVLITPPTYGMYKVLADINNVACKTAPLKEDFHLDVPTILQNIDNRTKLLFFCSPNNPTANSFDVTEIEHIIRNFNGLVIIDEAYIDFSCQKSWLTRLQDFPNLIVCQTFSKAYGMAGIRLGSGFASAEIITVLKKIKPPYNINKLTQERALELLADEITYQKQLAAIIQAREQLLNNLSQLSYIKKIYPTDANFILIKVDDADKCYHELIDRGIVVRNRTMHKHCKNCLRITVGTEEENSILLTEMKSLGDRCRTNKKYKKESI